MKISLITLYSKHNYGALLQKYATYKFLEKSGYNVCLIDYQPKKYKLNNFKALLKDLLIYIRIQKFHCFNKKFFTNKTVKYRKFSDLMRNPPVSDLYIVGSDQVWNSNLSWNDSMTKKQLNPAFLLDFVEKGSKISFASSIGSDKIKPEEEVVFKDHLPKFHAISVREESAKNILNNLGINNVYVVLDPVFLLDKNEYLKIANKQKLKRHNYLLIYSAEKNKVLNNISKRIASQENLKIVEIGNYKKNYDSDLFFNQIGVEDFLGLFANSKYIVTSSFHGLAFSIIFEKSFIAVRPHERATRLENLLNQINMSERLINSEIEFESIEKINYENTKALLTLKIENSKKYLEESIKSSFI